MEENRRRTPVSDVGLLTSLLWRIMAEREHLLGIFEDKRHQKLVLTVSVVVFLFLEVLIYLAAASQAGQKSRVTIADINGAKVYETPGAVLTSYEKLLFENNFGPLSNYQVRVETESLTFPFRAWLSSAVGIPVGLILLVAFIVRAYLSLLYGDHSDKEKASEAAEAARTSLGSVFHFFHNISIFHIGFLTLLAVLILWMVPNLVEDFARLSLDAIREFRWFFAGAAVFLALLVVWIIYLRYRLSRQMLENQLDLEKFRVEKQLLLETKAPQLLPNPVNDFQEP
jgi:hypothetical protein